MHQPCGTFRAQLMGPDQGGSCSGIGLFQTARWLLAGKQAVAEVKACVGGGPCVSMYNQQWCGVDLCSSLLVG